jgi:transcription elongation factor GreA
METRIKRLQSRLRMAVVVEATDGDDDAFSFGRTAEVLDESKGESVTWTLVGSTEANLAEGKLSAESPIGAALMDTAVGATVEVQTPRGSKTFKVLKLVG